MPEIDHDGPVAVYLQLAAILRGQIASGEISPGRAIPSKRALVERYGVSRGTVDHAMTVLKAEGLIEPAAGRGLYVTGK